MTFPWPAFVRRALILRRARIALESGDRERCVELLRDPGLSLSARAEELRNAALEQWSREARRLAAAGQAADVEGIVARLSAEDPTRASLVRRELGFATTHSTGAMISDILARVRASARLPRSSTDAPASPAIISGGASRASSADRPASAASTNGSGTRRTSAMPAADSRAATMARVIAPNADVAPRDGEPVVRFHVAVDDGGEFFVAGGAALTLGHLRSPEASLPFLADVENRHVRFVCTESFHGGTCWSLERLAARDARVNGEELGDAPRVLRDGDEVVLARNLALRYRQPDDSSGSALLELAAGAECQGVRRVVLLAPGEAGRVRIGSKRNRHIPVPDLAHEVLLVWSNGALSVNCAGGVRLAGGSAASAGVPSLSIPCPPRASSSFIVGAREKAGPPFAIHVRPPEPPPSSGAQR
jgi:hypothetical protein